MTRRFDPRRFASLRPPSIEHRRVKLPLDIWQGLRAIADAKNTTVQRIAGILLSTVVRDKLYDAIVDEEPRAVRRSATTRDPIWLGRMLKERKRIAPIPS
jgi:hypothetical protein